MSDFIAKLIAAAGEVGEAMKTDDHEGEEREAETKKMVWRGVHRLAVEESCSCQTRGRDMV